MDTSPALTSGQLRSLHLAFRYLGYAGRSERPYRLAAAADALGLEQLGSFKDLTAGQAGNLHGRLRRGEIPAFGGWPHEGIGNAGANAPRRLEELDAATMARVAAALRAAVAVCVFVVWFFTADRQTRIAIAVIACSGMRDSPA